MIGSRRFSLFSSSSFAFVSKIVSCVVWKRVTFVSIPSSSDFLLCVTLFSLPSYRRLPGHWFLILRISYRQHIIACSLYFKIQQIFFLSSLHWLQAVAEKVVQKADSLEEIRMWKGVQVLLVVGFFFLPVLLLLFLCPDFFSFISPSFFIVWCAFHLLLLLHEETVRQSAREHGKRGEED